MTLCPIAIVATCKKCPIFKVCLVKSVIGDYKKTDDMQTKKHAKKAQRGAKREG